MCVTQRFLWPSGDPQSDAAPLAAPRGLWLGVAHPDVCQQVHQLQSYRWWACHFLEMLTQHDWIILIRV